jgi:hypothetical protein
MPTTDAVGIDSGLNCLVGRANRGAIKGPMKRAAKELCLEGVLDWGPDHRAQGLGMRALELAGGLLADRLFPDNDWDGKPFAARLRRAAAPSATLGQHGVAIRARHILTVSDASPVRTRTSLDPCVVLNADVIKSAASHRRHRYLGKER